MPNLLALLRQRPGYTLTRLLWVLFNIISGAALGWLICYGLLNLDGWPVWAGTVLAGAAIGGLWVWQWSVDLRSQADQARRVKLGLVGFMLAAVLVIGGYSLWSLYRIGRILPNTASYAGNFERLWGAMKAAYPYFDEKGVDWAAVREHYAPLVAQVKSDEEYYALVDEILRGLQDGHTRLSVNAPAGEWCCFAMAEEIEGRAVITSSGPEARQAGLIPGTILLSVDGRPVEDLVAEQEERVIVSTPWQRRYLAFFRLLSLPADRMTAEVSFLAAEGEVVSVLLQREEDSSGRQTAQLDSTPLIRGERLPSEAGLIRIPTFSSSTGHDLVAEFDLALDSLMDAPGIILDLRGNSGGSTFISDRIAGRFFDQVVEYGYEVYPLRLPMRGYRSRGTYIVQPRGNTYHGPVILLTDPANFSTAENFIAALVDSGRAGTVGQVTGGGSGNPVSFDLPGGAQARFSTGAFHRLNGALIEGQGIEPDFPVLRTIQDVIDGRDTVLETAQEVLLSGRE